MAKYNLAIQYWEEVSDRLRTNKQQYANFLKFASSIYKHDFSESAMIYHQNPNATKVLELSQWNKLGRTVNRGERSIVAFGDGCQCKYLFDVSQTMGKKEPSLWRLDNDLSERLRIHINHEFGMNSETLDKTIAELCVKNFMNQVRNKTNPYYDALSLEQKKVFNRSALSAARYIISNRCQLNGDIQLNTTLNLDALDLFRSRSEFQQFADLVHTTAKQTLLSIEKELLKVMKLKSQEMQPEVNLPFSVGDFFDINNALYKIEQIDIPNNAVRLTDISSNTPYSRSMSINELVMFYTEEQKREAEIYSAIDGILGDSPIIENEPVTVTPEIKPFEDETLIEELLSHEEFRYERNQSVYDFFQNTENMQERTDYIKRIFHDNGEITFNGIHIGFEKTENGLTIYQGTSDNRELQSGLSWNAVSAKFSDMSEQHKLTETPVIQNEPEFEPITEPEELLPITRRIQCETSEQAEELFEFLRNEGYTWIDGEDLHSTEWIFNEENTYYSLNEETKTINIGNVTALSPERFKNIQIEKFSDIRDEFLPGKEFTEPEKEEKFQLNFYHGKEKVEVVNQTDSRGRETIAEIFPDRSIDFKRELPESVKNIIGGYAQDMPDIYVMPVIREPMPGEPVVTIAFSENCNLEAGMKIPFSQANEIFSEIESNYLKCRENALTKYDYIGYDKTDFVIQGEYSGQAFRYEGRFDIGDGEGTLMNHIHNAYQELKTTDWSWTPEQSEERQRSLKAYETEIIPYLEQYAEQQPDRQVMENIPDEEAPDFDSFISSYPETSLAFDEKTAVTDEFFHYERAWHNVDKSIRDIAEKYRNGEEFQSELAKYFIRSDAGINHNGTEYAVQTDEHGITVSSGNHTKSYTWEEAGEKQLKTLKNIFREIQQERVREYPETKSEVDELLAGLDKPEISSEIKELVTREMYQTDTADIFKIPNKDGQLIKIDITPTENLFARLAEHGVKPQSEDETRIILETDGQNWNKLIIPDQWGNLTNNIDVNEVFTPEEITVMQTAVSSILYQEPIQMSFDDIKHDTIRVSAAIHSAYKDMTAFVGTDDKVYIGKSENYDNHGNYDNSDNSFLFVSDNKKMFYFISFTEGWVSPQQEMLDKKIFTLEDYREYTRLQKGVLSQFEQLKEKTFAGEPFRPVADETILTVPEKIQAKNYHFSPEDTVIGGAKAKYRANIEAIKTLQNIESENRNATPEEQAVMAKYSGWGGISQAFDPFNQAWKSEYEELKKLLTESEYKAARASSTTAFYTPPEVTGAVYQALSQFGFEGGNVLEPSMGIGNFVAKMPESIMDKSRVYGVELDSISGRIAQKLYPKENIQIKGFEQTTFNDNSFDVAVGNIPFGDIPVADRAYDKFNFKIHDYFAAKTVDKVKPGGIIALVASKFVMDKQNEAARQYIAERADLLGAVRLPAGTFKDADNVTTDILILQKRETHSVEIPDWVHMGTTADGIPCNQYFVDNPDMILGKMEYDRRMQGKYGADSKVTTCTPIPGENLQAQLQNAISKIKGKFHISAMNQSQALRTDTIPADPSVRNFTHTIVNGTLYFRRNEVMERVQEKGKKLQRIMGLHSIRKAAFEVINAQAENRPDSEVQAAQKRLNAVYDNFVSHFGHISDRSNALAFKEDDDYNTLRAFEITDKKTGEIRKAEIFYKRTITPDEEVSKADTPEEALQISLDRKGKVDIPYMSEITGVNPEELITALNDRIYRNPAKAEADVPYSGYEDASAYLSGNVREKLEIAQMYTEKIDPSYQKNVTALEQVLPKTIGADEITVSIGVGWVDTEDYARFMEEYAKADMRYHALRRTPMGSYQIEDKQYGRNVYATSTYGTSRMNSYAIFEALLNKKDIVVRDSKDVDGTVTYVVNQKETQLAREKARQMKEAFKEWFWKDIDRREKYVERYNRLFNSIRGREYDGSHQTFPGMNPAIQLRPHQQNAVMRGKLGGNTLLAHCVGAGKSFEIDTIVMEKKRLGLIHKACVVVPKHLTMQTAYEWQRLYPNAKLLVATPADFATDKRKEFLARCVTGDYDGVIMSFEQFKSIPMSDEYRRRFIEGQIDQITTALQNASPSDRLTIKDLERMKRKLEVKLEKLLGKSPDESLKFEQMGFDYLVCDEAHYYKNCLVVTKMNNVAGVQTTSASKSEDMLMKTQYLRDKYGEGTTLYATGTPVSNSMVELYSMTRYLRPDLLEKAGLQTFDDWASTFGEVVSQLEMKPAGDGFRVKNRFAKFNNIPELMQMYKEFADIQMPDTLHIPGIPDMQTGKPIVVTSKPDELQKEYMKVLAERSELIHSGAVKPWEDNMLKVTHEARLLGLDGRCINKDWTPNPDSKVNKLIDNLLSIHQKTEQDKGVQIVFCDIAIHEDNDHFSVYNAIRDELIKRGIPENEICFAGDAKNDRARAEMYEQLRNGEKRIILASTSKLGTGANVQDRICAIHHLDIPWRPSDLEQQNGRGLRQGNKFSEVGIYHYVTENTFDAYMLGIITAKAKFISQVMTSREPARTCEDVDEMVLNYAEMQAIASGNPLIKEKIQLENDISRLRMLEAEHKKNLYHMQETAHRILPEQISRNQELLEKAKSDLQTVSENKPEEFSITIGNEQFTERTAAAEELEKKITECIGTGSTMFIGKYAGLDLVIKKNPDYGRDLLINSDSPCFLEMRGKLTYTCELGRDNGIGNIKRIENLADTAINKRVSDIQGTLKTNQENLTAALAECDKEFIHAEELTKAVSRLAEVDRLLGTNKAEDTNQIVDDTSSEPSGETEETDISSKADTMFKVEKYDISHLQQKPENKSENSESLNEKPPIKKRKGLI